MSAFARLLGTFFYLGYVPQGPGTAGSLGALAVAWALHAYLGISGVCLAFFGVVLIAPAVWAAGRMAKDTGSKDPQVVVIDEVVGQWITLAGASTLDWKTWLGAFLLFRAFDIWKPPPVRQMERIPGGAGIVLDDAMAGIYAALVLYFAGWFNR
ncbi:MAG TPA: phosphatidylglycerophosphatase A [Bryobacteraceae bacterium]|jgi:phosphatidylglycerophosphatase A|nr:phosphatidylglycerophosphatase A [Bryobacteraceae bacterium]